MCVLYHLSTVELFAFAQPRATLSTMVATYSDCSFDKLKCFRVMDEDGNIINRRYEGSIDDNTMQKMFRTMVMMNEADVVYNQA